MADEEKCSKTGVQIQTDRVSPPVNKSIYKHDRTHHQCREFLI